MCFVNSVHGEAVIDSGVDWCCHDSFDNPMGKIVSPFDLQPHNSHNGAFYDSISHFGQELLTKNINAS